MGLSTALLGVALASAAIPMAVLRFAAPASQRDFEKAFVSAVAVIVVGAFGVRAGYDLGFFGLAHLAYLLAVVTLPVLTIGWWVSARVRGGRRRAHDLMAAAGAVVALCGIYATHIEPGWLRVDRATVIADVAAPFRIAVIADLQTPNVGGDERDAIATVLAEQPDIVVIPGDWFHGETSVIEANRADFVELLAELVRNVEVVAVTTGDTDHSIPLGPMVVEAGAFFIDDTVLDVTIRGVPVRLAGVRVLANGPDRANTLAALREPAEGFSLLVAHRPDVVYELPAGADVDLVVSGHTHGGQVAIPFFGPPVTFTAVPREAAAGGLSVVDNVPLYVSTGVGMERLQAPQVRFLVRPSVGIIDVIPR